MTSRFGSGVTAELSGGNPCMTRLTLSAGHVQCRIATTTLPAQKMEEEKKRQSIKRGEQRQILMGDKGSAM